MSAASCDAMRDPVPTITLPYRKRTISLLERKAAECSACLNGCGRRIGSNSF